MRDLGVMCLCCGGQFAQEALPLACPSGGGCDLLVVYLELLPTRADGCPFSGHLPSLAQGPARLSPGKCFLGPEGAQAEV